MTYSIKIAAFYLLFRPARVISFHLFAFKLYSRSWLAKTLMIILRNWKLMRYFSIWRARSACVSFFWVEFGPKLGITARCQTHAPPRSAACLKSMPSTGFIAIELATILKLFYAKSGKEREVVLKNWLTQTSSLIIFDIMLNLI